MRTELDTEEDEFNVQKAPFPWFGGKSKAAPAVWEALGDVEHYVEPFCGSMAVLLNRPHVANRPYHSETVNDADGLLVNAWRAIQLHPDQTAEAASWPVAEADLMARHLALVRWRQDVDLERLMADPAWCDPKMAGWWLWGVSCWIGGGWCNGSGPWVVRDGRVAKGEDGVSLKRPQLGNDGRGVNTAAMREEGLGDFHPVTMPRLRRWFAYLSARLRHVRIINGDWRRVVTSGATLTINVGMGKGVCGVFLDPPYADTASRTRDLYRVDSEHVAHDVREWALEHGTHERYRVVVAGFEGEHGDAFTANGWREVEWFVGGFLKGGMGNQSKSKGKGHQQHRERLWLSPTCLRTPTGPAQRGLFGGGQ